MTYIEAPDFPTGGIIYGYEGVKEAFHTGRGRCNDEADIQELDGREYHYCNGNSLSSEWAEMIHEPLKLVNDKKIEGISNIPRWNQTQGTR